MAKDLLDELEIYDETENILEDLLDDKESEADILDMMKPFLKKLNKIDRTIEKKVEDIANYRADKADTETNAKILKLSQQIQDKLDSIKDGKDYILTEQDKKDIAKYIKVPIVEKIIEKREIVKEVPIVTNEIKEIAKYETGEQIVDKINQLPDKEEYKIDVKHIKWLDQKGKTTYIWVKHAINWVKEWGTTWQKLVKKSNQDYDTEWVDDSWGWTRWSITGTLSAQTDLQTALDSKANLSGGNTLTGLQTIENILVKNGAGGDRIYFGSTIASTPTYITGLQGLGQFELYSGTNLLARFGLTTAFIRGTITFNNPLTVQGSGTEAIIRHYTGIHYWEAGNIGNNYAIRNVTGSNTIPFFINRASNNVGVGTTTPLRTLHVVGTSPVLSTINTYNGAIIENSDNVVLLLATGINREAVISFGDNSNNNIGQIAYSNTNDSMRFRVNDIDRITINNAGNTRIANDLNTTDSRVLDVDNTYIGTGYGVTMRVKQRTQNCNASSSIGFTMQSEIFGTTTNTTSTDVIGGEYYNLFHSSPNNVTITNSIGIRIRTPWVTELWGVVTVTNNFWQRIDNQGNARITNSYWIYIDEQSWSSSLNYSIYSAWWENYLAWKITTPSDIEITDITKWVILKSPNWTRWRITVDNTGALTTTAL